MKELITKEEKGRTDLIYIEMESGFHIAIDASYVDQVKDFKITLPTGEILDTSKLK